MGENYYPALPDLRAFLANSKGDKEEVIGMMVDVARRALLPIAHGRTVYVTSGLDDWNLHFSRCGSWEAWQRDVAQGIDYLTREPRYHTMIVPARRVGKATAAIVDGFFFVGKPVLYISEGGVLAQITECVKVAERDWQTGWEVR